ncbi:mitochondrial inner membrane protein OXA1L [Neodiprion virginianus]|uniref:mitochondrial inner membrane protein OXA1L n=1 Tax=Neodiprion fabricii TaxID=2872261 RepID=UPI001ED8F24E|nr:mitochondrial inner membrane protein OXA1L [Neodiprion fabricii]XP_046604915.1 mitochondrial inner membrane protein OXA1L [Neodiprion virginianus]
MLSRMSLRLHNRTLAKTYSVSKVLVSHRSLHVTRKFENTGLKNFPSLGLSRHKPILGTAFVRCASTVEDKIPDNLLPNIPEPPSLPAPEVVDIVQGLSEPPITALGLGSNWPPGLIQSALEYLHIGLGLPWWGTIMIGTICVRLLVFPLVIKAQRNSAKMNNYMPQVQYLQAKMTEAREYGNDFDAARYGQDLYTFMKSKGISPLKSALVPLVQAPFFVSFFMALRGMANAPVESLRTGGLWWFTDLTIPDQYYLLPLITSATMYVTIKIGADGLKLDTLGPGFMAHAIKAIPIIMFPFIMHFDGAILVYWTSTNFISLGQAMLLKVPSVRTFFKIEATIKHAPTQLAPNKGFVKGFKESWSNMKLAGALQDRGEADHMEFERAGRGPVPKTYKYNPTAQTPPPTRIMARKRD